MPMIAISCASSFELQRLQSAGKSLRFARSPKAPKMTITAGPSLGAYFSHHACHARKASTLRASLRRRFGTKPKSSPVIARST